MSRSEKADAYTIEELVAIRQRHNLGAHSEHQDCDCRWLATLDATEAEWLRILDQSQRERETASRDAASQTVDVFVDALKSLFAGVVPPNQWSQTWPPHVPLRIVSQTLSETRAALALAQLALREAPSAFRVDLREQWIAWGRAHAEALGTARQVQS